MDDMSKEFEKVASSTVLLQQKKVLSEAIDDPLQGGKEIISEVDGEKHLPSPPKPTIENPIRRDKLKE